MIWEPSEDGDNYGSVDKEDDEEETEKAGLQTRIGAAVRRLSAAFTSRRASSGDPNHQTPPGN